MNKKCYSVELVEGNKWLSGIVAGRGRNISQKVKSCSYTGSLLCSVVTIVDKNVSKLKIAKPVVSVKYVLTMERKYVR